MLELPVDSWYAWIGIAVVSVAVLAASVTLPLRPPPDAGDAADTVDAIAGGEYPATAEHGIAAERMRLTPTRIALRNAAGTTTGTFLFDPVTPAVEDERLERVLRGMPPSRVFASPTAFAKAAESARADESRWQPAPNRLRVRQVHWGETRVTLVG